MNASGAIEHSAPVLLRLPSRRHGKARFPRLGTTGSKWLGSIQLRVFMSQKKKKHKRYKKPAAENRPSFIIVPATREWVEHSGALNKPVWEYNADLTAALSYIWLFIYYFRTAGLLQAAGFQNLRGGFLRYCIVLCKKNKKRMNFSDQWIKWRTYAKRATVSGKRGDKKLLISKQWPRVTLLVISIIKVKHLWTLDCLCMVKFLDINSFKPAHPPEQRIGDCSNKPMRWQFGDQAAHRFGLMYVSVPAATAASLLLMREKLRHIGPAVAITEPRPFVLSA